MKKLLVATCLAASVLVASASIGLAADSTGAGAKHYANCTALNKVYPHGVGKPRARDHVSGSSKPVTNFYVSKALYTANSGSDRDKDGIACEKL